MNSNTAVINIQLKINNDTISNQKFSSVKAMSMPVGITVEKEVTVGKGAAFTHVGLVDSALTIIVPHGSVDLNFTIGTSSFSYTDVTVPVVLPGAITSVAMIANTSNSGDTITVYIFQGA